MRYTTEVEKQEKSSEEKNREPLNKRIIDGLSKIPEKTTECVATVLMCAMIAFAVLVIYSLSYGFVVAGLLLLVVGIFHASSGPIMIGIYGLVVGFLLYDAIVADVECVVPITKAPAWFKKKYREKRNS